MASTHVELRALVDEVRRGSVRYCAGDPCRLEVSPRSRLLRQLVAVEVSLSGSQHRTPAEITAAPPAERFGLLASKQLDCRFAKCRRVGACLACTLRPCLCPQLPPLRLGHKLWLIMHPNEALRTTNSGKLLLLAHPDANLLIGGIPEHEAILRQLVRRPNVVLLYPAEDALTPAQCAAMAHRTPAQCAARAGRGAPGSGAAAAPPEGYAGINTGAPLELIVVDGTWQQAKVLAKRVPPSVPRVALAAAPQRSLFGSSLREQSAEREAQGRVCTVEAVGMLALQMGEPPEEVEALLGYLATFIGACVPTVRRVRRREHSH